MKTYEAKELASMSLKTLADIGAGLGLKFTKNHNRSARAKKILAAQAEKTATTKPVRSSAPGETHTASVEPILHEQNPDFERLCETPSIGGDTAESAEAQRGGVRVGAGRPAGMTEEVAAYNNLPQQPNPAIRQLFELAFNTWADRANCPEVALSKEQAHEISLPWTQAAHLAGVTDKIPPWLMVALACIWSTYNMVIVKAKLAREAQKPEEKIAA